MKQIALGIERGSAPSLENFVASGDAGLALQALRALRQPAPAAAAVRAVYLWGPSGSGKTHLLQALARAVLAEGGRVAHGAASQPTPWRFEPGCALVLLDDCEQLDEDQQHAAFTLFVEAATAGVPLAAAGRCPPVDLPLREDLRSRLGWGTVFGLQPLAEAQAREVLKGEAQRRGLPLSDEVLDHLLTRFARDLKHLMRLLDRLDAFAWQHKRALTLPLLRQMLAEDASATAAP
jgi:DnaA-homolog protein